MTALLVAVVVILGLLGFLVAGLLRSNAELTRAMHQMGVDLSAAAPSRGATTSVSLTARPTPGRPDVTDLMDLSGTTPRGDAVRLAVHDVEHDTLVAFLTSGCQTCRGFWEEFRAGVPDVPGGARLVTVTRGPEAESAGTIASLAGERVPVVMSTEVWDHYDVPYAPYFVYVSGAAGRVMGEGVAARWEEVRTLVATAVADGTTTARATRRAGADRAAGTGAGTPDTSADDDLDRRWRKSRADLDRSGDVDRELEAAGIRPGDPRLHPRPVGDQGGEAR